MPRIVIGCDLSLAWLDIHALPEGARSRIENIPAGINGRVAGIDPAALLVSEATSGCDGPLIAAFAARGIAFARVNPRQARDFARATGILAKTGRVDARVLAEMGRRLPLEATAPPDPDRVRLADFLQRRRRLVCARKAEKVRRPSAGRREILPDTESTIALFDRRIETLDHGIAALIAKSPGFAACPRLLAPIPGIGPTVLATLLGEFPELGTLCRRQIASPDPHARESGTGQGTRSIRSARRKVREALSIAALTATRRIRGLVALRRRMRAAGKAPKTILIAAGRQLLLILNAMIRTGQPVRP